MDAATIKLILLLAATVGQLVESAIAAYNTLTPDEQSKLDTDLAAQLVTAKAKLDAAIAAKGG